MIDVDMDVKCVNEDWGEVDTLLWYSLKTLWVDVLIGLARLGRLAGLVSTAHYTTLGYATV